MTFQTRTRALCSGVLLALLLLTGCGNKGPLFIPQEHAEPRDGPQAPQEDNS